MKTLLSIPALAALLLLTACKAPNSVVFVTTTGINVEASTAAGTESTAHVGFNRFEGVIMPGRYSNGTPRTNAYPVISRMDFTSGSVFLPAMSLTNVGGGAPLRIHQVFATGRAATPSSVKATSQDFNKLTGKVASSKQARSLQGWFAGMGATKNEQVGRRKIVADWLNSKGKPSHGGAVLDFIENETREDERALFISENGLDL